MLVIHMPMVDTDTHMPMEVMPPTILARDLLMLNHHHTIMEVMVDIEDMVDTDTEDTTEASVLLMPTTVMVDTDVATDTATDVVMAMAGVVNPNKRLRDYL